MQIRVKFQVKPLKAMQQAIPTQVIPVALARGLNKTLQSTQSTAVKAIANNLGVKQQRIRTFLTLSKAWRQRLVATLRAPNKRRLTLLQIDPKARQNARGVAYRTSGKKQQIDHAFIVTMKNGHRGIYNRKKGAKRLPVRELQGASVQQVFRQPTIQAQMKATIDQRWPIVSEQELSFELKRRGYAKS